MREGMPKLQTGVVSPQHSTSPEVSKLQSPWLSETTLPTPVSGNSAAGVITFDPSRIDAGPDPLAFVAVTLEPVVEAVGQPRHRARRRPGTRADLRTRSGDNSILW